MPADNRWVTQKLHEMWMDPSAFEQLYAEMRQPMYVVAYRIVMSREDAEDAVQEAFVSLLRCRETESVRNGRAYLFQTVRNAALGIRKLRNKETVVGDTGDLPRKKTARSGGSDVGLAMAVLTDEERQIVTLRVEAELGFTEIARIMGISTATAFRRYRGAIRSLRQYFGRSSDGKEEEYEQDTK